MAIQARQRIRIFVQRFWQPTSACMTCMVGSWGNVFSLPHWIVALHTGLLTGILAVLLTFTPVRRMYENRYGNAFLVGCLTAIGDAYAHVSAYHFHLLEHLLTGLVSGVLALAASFILEDRARRLRAIWARLAK